MAEYKIIGIKWDNARTLSSTYYDGQTIQRYEAPAASEELSEYGRLGWKVVNCWRTDSGTVWFVLEG